MPPGMPACRAGSGLFARGWRSFTSPSGWIPVICAAGASSYPRSRGPSSRLGSSLSCSARAQRTRPGCAKRSGTLEVEQMAMATGSFRFSPASRQGRWRTGLTKSRVGVKIEIGGLSQALPAFSPLLASACRQTTSRWRSRTPGPSRELVPTPGDPTIETAEGKRQSGRWRRCNLSSCIGS